MKRDTNEKREERREKREIEGETGGESTNPLIIRVTRSMSRATALKITEYTYVHIHT